jgi:hypothetical protein
MTIEARFREFHAENPNVYRTLVRLARELKDANYSYASIGMLWEVVRHQGLSTTTTERYRLSDNFRSRYARHIMEQEEDLAGFFRTRPLRAA